MKKTRKTLAMMVLTLCCAACSSLRTGDLLFHVVEQGNRITDVTPGMIDHVAIYTGNDHVIEAIPEKGVVTTPLDSLLHRERGHYVVGRVKRADRQQSVSNARRYLGLPYDSLYLPDNEAIYCSELVQLSLVDQRGRKLFAPVPMTFRNADGQIPLSWQQLYQRHGLPVPEGEPGSNPGEMSQRRQVTIKKLK